MNLIVYSDCVNKEKPFHHYYVRLVKNDQPVLLFSRMRPFALSSTESESAEQIVRMPRLTLAFACRIPRKTHFLMAPFGYVQGRYIRLNTNLF